METCVIQPTGALVISAERMPVGTRLEAINLRTDRRGWFRVAWRWPDDESDAFKLGLEPLEPQPDFWGGSGEAAPV